jgi:replicative superfamily II helicase
MNEIAYRKTLASLAQGHQVMVFVHSRRDTVKTAMWMRAFAEQESKSEWFTPKEDEHGPYDSLHTIHSFTRSFIHFFIVISSICCRV